MRIFNHDDHGIKTGNCGDNEMKITLQRAATQAAV